MKLDERRERETSSSPGAAGGNCRRKGSKEKTSCGVHSYYLVRRIGTKEEVGGEKQCKQKIWGFVRGGGGGGSEGSE